MFPKRSPLLLFSTFSNKSWISRTSRIHCPKVHAILYVKVVVVKRKATIILQLVSSQVISEYSIPSTTMMIAKNHFPTTSLTSKAERSSGDKKTGCVHGPFRSPTKLMDVKQSATDMKRRPSLGHQKSSKNMDSKHRPCLSPPRRAIKGSSERRQGACSSPRWSTPCYSAESSNIEIQSNGGRMRAQKGDKLKDNRHVETTFVSRQSAMDTSFRSASAVVSPIQRRRRSRNKNKKTTSAGAFADAMERSSTFTCGIAPESAAPPRHRLFRGLSDKEITTDVRTNRQNGKERTTRRLVSNSLSLSLRGPSKSPERKITINQLSSSSHEMISCGRSSATSAHGTDPLSAQHRRRPIPKKSLSLTNMDLSPCATPLRRLRRPEKNDFAYSSLRTPTRKLSLPILSNDTRETFTPVRRLRRHEHKDLKSDSLNKLSRKLSLPILPSVTKQHAQSSDCTRSGRIHFDCSPTNKSGSILKDAEEKQADELTFSALEFSDEEFSADDFNPEVSFASKDSFDDFFADVEVLDRFSDWRTTAGSNKCDWKKCWHTVEMWIPLITRISLSQVCLFAANHNSVFVTSLWYIVGVEIKEVTNDDAAVAVPLITTIVTPTGSEYTCSEYRPLIK